MDCRNAQDWLLQAEDAWPDSRHAPEVAAHLRTCRDCRLLARRLETLAEAWQAVPLPEESEAAKRAFLDRLASPRPRPAPPERPTRRRFLRWCAASAASVLAVGAGGWLLVSDRQARAADELLDQLVDWNLHLTQAQSEAERSQVYADQAEQLQSAVDSLRVPEEQKTVAQSLLETGAWLAVRRDPIDEADRFHGLADRLLQLARTAEVRGNVRRMDRFLSQYNRVVESGIDVNVDRLEASGALDFEHQRKLERLALRDAQHLRQLATLLETAPGVSRAEIERALRRQKKRAKKSPRGKPAKRNAAAS